MWGFAVEMINQKPLWGWGMDGSRWIPQNDRRLKSNMEIMPLHPHNAFLQVRLELGLVGSALAASLIAVFFWVVVARMDNKFDQSVIAGVATAYLTVAAVSYGIWQNWWLAFAWVLVAMMRLVLKKEHSEPQSD